MTIRLHWRYCFAWQKKIMKFDVLCEIFSIICIFRVLLFDSLLWDSRKVSSYQYSLNWDDNLSCKLKWIAWCTFSIHVCMFRFCQDVCNDTIFCNLWFYAKIWRDVVFDSRMSRSLTFSICFNLNEMFFQSIVISFSTCALLRNYTKILTKCLQRFIFSQFMISSFDSCLHAQILTRCL